MDEETITSVFNTFNNLTQTSEIALSSFLSSIPDEMLSDFREHIKHDCTNKVKNKVKAMGNFQLRGQSRCYPRGFIWWEALTS